MSHHPFAFPPYPHTPEYDQYDKPTNVTPPTVTPASLCHAVQTRAPPPRSGAASGEMPFRPGQEHRGVQFAGFIAEHGDAVPAMQYALDRGGERGGADPRL